VSFPTAQELAWIVASGAMTAVGGLGLLFAGRPSDRLLDALSGFTGGVMLAATSFSLLVPALDRGSVVAVAMGLLLGGALFAVLDGVLPHIHLRFAERGHTEPIPLPTHRHRAALLLSALTIHNIPEGMAVGLAFAAGGADLGIPLAVAIGIQNIPEGFAAAAPLLGGPDPTKRPVAAGVAALTGAVEPPAALAAMATFGIADALLPLGLAFAGGAMLYVVVDELIPESRERGNERLATLALLGGFTLMLVLDNALG
jgi:zinc transporter, ZIP family